MTTQVFINIAVKDLPKSKAFYSALGYTFHPDFTNDDGASMIVSDTIYVMLLREGHFQSFTDRTIVDPRTHVETLTCFSVESREKVDELVDKAAAAGGSAGAATDYGFMYSRSFTDIDGHAWELVHMSSMPPKE